MQAKALQKIGDSNRGVPGDERVVVSYTPGQDLVVTWAIDNGAAGEHPTGTPTCTAPPTDPVTTTTTSTATTTLPGEGTTTTTTTTLPSAKRTTQEQARNEASAAPAVDQAADHEPEARHPGCAADRHLPDRGRG